MRILVVEDEGSIFKMIKEQMNTNEYELVQVRSVSEATGEYNSSKVNNPFDCHIVDLQIGSKGLNEEKMVKFFYREGYAWIKEVLETLKTKEEKVAFKKKTIICSKYASDFMKEYTAEELKDFIIIPKKIGFETEVKKSVIRIRI